MITLKRGLFFFPGNSRFSEKCSHRVVAGYSFISITFLFPAASSLPSISSKNIKVALETEGGDQLLKSCLVKATSFFFDNSEPSKHF